MTITASNYAAHARRMVGAYVDMYRAGGCEGDAQDLSMELDLTSLVADRMDKAVHFAIPDGAVLFEDDLRGLRGQKLRLPYPSVTVEWYQPPGQDNYPLKKIVVCAFEVTKEDCELLQDDRGILIAGAREHDGEWCPSTAFVVVPEAWEHADADSRTEVGKSRGLAYAWGITHYRGMVERMGQAAADDALDRDMSTEFFAILQFCEAMSCSNVGTATIGGAPASVNAKRIKNGKLPLLETRVLTVEMPGQAGAQRLGAAEGQGTVRQHLRRGHIRRISEGRRIWVNSCVVGNPDKGRIEKDYRVCAAEMEAA